MGGCYTTHSTDTMHSFPLRCLSPNGFIKQGKCQHTIIETVLLTRNDKIKQSNENLSQFCTLHDYGPTHWLHAEFFPQVSLPTQFNQPKVEYLLSNEYCNLTCEIGNGWCDIHSKTSHSIDWTAQQKWTLFFRIYLVNADKPVRKVIQNIMFGIS